MDIQPIEHTFVVDDPEVDVSALVSRLYGREDDTRTAQLPSNETTDSTGGLDNA